MKDIKENQTMYFYKTENKILITDEKISFQKELTANTTDGAHEKHVPVIEQHGDHVTVMVGSIEHPMLSTHYIEWIILETATGYQKKERYRACADNLDIRLNSIVSPCMKKHNHKRAYGFRNVE